MGAHNAGSIVVVDGKVVQGAAKDLAELEEAKIVTTRRRFLSRAAQLVSAAIAVGILGKAASRSAAAQPVPGCFGCGHCIVYRQVSPGCYSQTNYSCYDADTSFCFNSCWYGCCICESRALTGEQIVVVRHE